MRIIDGIASKDCLPNSRTGTLTETPRRRKDHHCRSDQPLLRHTGRLKAAGGECVPVADPPVLILDEATSSIDTRTEPLVQGAWTG